MATEADELFQSAAIMALNDPLVGNRWIANLYFELDGRLVKCLHKMTLKNEPHNATFATFAAWSAESLAIDVGPDDRAVDESHLRSLALVDLDSAMHHVRIGKLATRDPSSLAAALSHTWAAERLVREVAAETGVQVNDMQLRRARADLQLAEHAALHDAIEATARAAATVETEAAGLRMQLVETGVGLRRNRDPRRVRGGILWRFYRRLARGLVDDDRIATNIAAGQGEILVEIGQALNAFEVRCDAGGPFDHKWWDAYSDDVARQSDEREEYTIKRAGALDRPVSETFGPANVAALLEAVRPYFDLRAEEDPAVRYDAKRRAEYILLGNLRLVAYEQRRLQPLLERNLGYVRSAAWRKAANRLSRLPYDAMRAAAQEVPRLEEFGEATVEASEILASRYAFNMILGDETLAFGRDLPLPPPANPLLRNRRDPTNAFKADMTHHTERLFFPNALARLHDPELKKVWITHSRSRVQGVPTKVDNWLRYEERMNFIANMFRSRQQLSALRLGRVVRSARRDPADNDTATDPSNGSSEILWPIVIAGVPSEALGVPRTIEHLHDIAVAALKIAQLPDVTAEHRVVVDEIHRNLEDVDRTWEARVEATKRDLAKWIAPDERGINLWISHITAAHAHLLAFKEALDSLADVVDAANGELHREVRGVDAAPSPEDILSLVSAAREGAVDGALDILLRSVRDTVVGGTVPISHGARDDLAARADKLNKARAVFAQALTVLPMDEPVAAATSVVAVEVFES